MLTLLTGLLLAQPFGGAFGSTGAGGSASSGTPRSATVAFYGDSIAQGECSGTAPPVALDALLPSGYSVTNLGVSGETAHQITSRVLSGAATACVGETCGTYVLEGGVNTLKHPSFDGSTTAEAVAAALNGTGNGGVCASGVAHSCGMLDAADYLHATYPRAQVLITGVLPYAGCTICGTNPDPGARAEAYNTALLVACASRPWLTCLSPYEAFEHPTLPDLLRVDYDCGDGIHLTNAGSAALAQEVYDAGAW